MKHSLSFPVLAAVTFSAAITLVGSIRAGSAVAGDGHGGYGYSYGPRSERELRREAVHRCRDKSRFPDDVEIAVATAARGAGVIVRYFAGGRYHIFAYAGADNARQAYEYAASGARDAGAEGRVEVVARWRDD